MISRSVAFHHFGCKVNFAEASSLSRQLQETGFELRNFHEMADIYVISTCVVTAIAEKKCRAAIRQAHKLNPKAKIAVIGCFSELKPGEISQMEGVDLVLGHSGKFNLLQELKKLEAGHEYHGGIQAENMHAADIFVPSYSFGDRTRTFLKIQDGCDYFCSYCTIPLARGRSRSDRIENIVHTTREIMDRGINEIVLTGVNIGDFGKQNGESFFDLVYALDRIPGIPRVRISSIEPDLLSDAIIDLVAGSRAFMPHFHIPLQSGSDKVLKSMRRKYSRDLFKSRAEKIRSRMPFACIAADIIAGFPGETGEDFRDALDFIRDLDISYLHVFTYSKREHTLAAKMEGILPDYVKKERSDLLHQLSDQKKRQFYHANEGREVDVLFESDSSHGFMYGFSENYLRVKTPFTSELINRIKRVKLDRMDDEGVFLI